jgi:membrane-bound lytic murein transglycosylase D
MKGGLMQYRDNRSVAFGKRQVKALALAGILGASVVGGVLEARAKLESREVVSAPMTGTERTPTPPPAMGELALDAGGAQDPVWDLPNLNHPRVDYFVKVFSGRQRKRFTRYLTRMGHYQPMISRKLAERGMPQDLIYLAMIESGFSPKAYSHAHASGLWQFISGTGRRYGLDINRAVDERRDPEKATDAALDYLSDLHRQFGSWYLAAAAYNTGEGRVARVMRQVTGSVRGNEYSYYKIRHRLPRETRDYVPLMVAAARIAKEPHKYGFRGVEIGEALVYDTVAVGSATPLANIARAAGTTVAEIRRLNPQLKLSRTRNDRPDVIRIPAGSRAAFAARWPEVRQERLAQADAPAKKSARVRKHRVRRGDNLTRIARRHGVSVSALKRANGLRGSRIRAGATLRIPAAR